MKYSLIKNSAPTLTNRRMLEFLPIVERESLLVDYSFSFDVNKLYNLANKESLC